jgi:hypothetical protein
MWIAMEMEVEREMRVRTKKDARREMVMRRRRQMRRKMRILLLNLCSGTYDQFIKNFICAS